MKKKVCSLVCLLFVAVAGFAQSLSGTWIIDKTIVKTTIAGEQSTTKEHAAGETVDSFAPGIKQLTFNAGKADVAFVTGETQQIGYTDDGKQLILMLPEAYYTYSYELDGDNRVQFMLVIDYMINGTKAQDDCTFYASKK